MSVLFEVKVSKIGELVSQLAQEKMLILFDEKAPKELHDITIIHTERKNKGEIQKGDILEVSGKRYTISFVGQKANQTLRELGHVTLKFNGGTDDLPGTICVEEETVPPVDIGMWIRIHSKDKKTRL